MIQQRRRAVEIDSAPQASTLEWLNSVWLVVGRSPWPTRSPGYARRSATACDAAVALELGESWRTAQTVVVLSVWPVAGFLVTPIVLRRMARRQSGAAVAAAKDAATQWVR